MEALNMSRGRAHTVLQELVDWKLAHPIKRIGTRQIKYVAEQDPWTMLLAILHQRKNRELVPLLELAKWNDEHKKELLNSGQEAFHSRLSVIVNRASQLNQALDVAKSESESLVVELGYFLHCEQSENASFHQCAFLPSNKFTSKLDQPAMNLEVKYVATP